jgi:hypothetical protein
MADCPHEVIGGSPIEREADHFILCTACGSWLDCRDLGELLAQDPIHSKGMQHVLKHWKLTYRSMKGMSAAKRRTVKRVQERKKARKREREELLSQGKMQPERLPSKGFGAMELM